MSTAQRKALRHCLDNIVEARRLIADWQFDQQKGIE
jgi:hypothetical protein